MATTRYGTSRPRLDSEPVRSERGNSGPARSERPRCCRVTNVVACSFGLIPPHPARPLAWAVRLRPEAGWSRMGRLGLPATNQKFVCSASERPTGDDRALAGSVSDAPLATLVVACYPGARVLRGEVRAVPRGSTGG